MSASRNPQQQQREPTANNAADAPPTTGTDARNIETVIIHSDGSYYQDDNLSGTGFVLETNGGDVIAERWDDAPEAQTSMETEATAALRAVQAAKQFNPSYIILYSDCKPLVQRLDQEHAPSNLKSVYRETREELGELEYSSIIHIPREQNERADELAHRALRERRADQTANGII